MTLEDARIRAQAACAVGLDAVALALLHAAAQGRLEGLTEATQVLAQQAAALRQAAEPEHTPEAVSQAALQHKAFAVEQAQRQVAALRLDEPRQAEEALHFAYRGKTPALDYLACNAQIRGTVSVADWARVTCSDCLAFYARCAR